MHYHVIVIANEKENCDTKKSSAEYMTSLQGEKKPSAGWSMEYSSKVSQKPFYGSFKLAALMPSINNTLAAFWRHNNSAWKLKSVKLSAPRVDTCTRPCIQPLTASMPAAYSICRARTRSEARAIVSLFSGQGQWRWIRTMTLHKVN